MSRSCAIDVNSFHKNIFNRTEEEREARAERETETAKGKKGRERLGDREEARREGISSAKMFPGKHIQRAVIRGTAFQEEGAERKSSSQRGAKLKGK